LQSPLQSSAWVHVRALVYLGLLAMPGVVQASDCAGPYHEALTGIRDRKAQQLSEVPRLVRTADASLPGRWLFSAGLVAQSRPHVRERGKNRFCAEPMRRRGRAHCVRREPQERRAQHGLSEPTAEELRVVRFVDDFVRARGAAPEFAKRGRHNWLVNRITTDLKAYISQPRHPFLCSGAKDMLDYFVGEMKALRRRIDDVAANHNAALDLARARIAMLQDLTRDAASGNADLVGQSPGQGATASEHATSSAHLPAPARLPALGEGATEHKSASIYVPLVGELFRLIGAHEPPATPAPDDPEFSLHQRLEQAGKALDSVGHRLSREVREAALAALRMVEAGVYAEMLHARYRALEEAIFGTIAEVREAHAKNCTCAD
jgi:hypothetical protein